MTWNTGAPATGNQVTADVADIEENFACLGPYRTIYVPATIMIPETSGGPAQSNNEYATNDVMRPYLAFDKDTDEMAWFSLVMPENWDRGTVKARFHWAAGGSTAAAAETVRWVIAANAVGDGDDIDRAVTSNSQVIDDTALTDPDGDHHISDPTPALTVQGSPALYDMVDFHIWRDVSEDDLADDAWLFGVVIQYSISEEIKTIWS
jgi:hypothetical protein